MTALRRGTARALAISRAGADHWADHWAAQPAGKRRRLPAGRRRHLRAACLTRALQAPRREPRRRVLAEKTSAILILGLVGRGEQPIRGRTGVEAPCGVPPWRPPVVGRDWGGDEAFSEKVVRCSRSMGVLAEAVGLDIEM
eukprot:CAMPEP_0204011064 /NCGR_PEP_ID=MMETSP0360-20130528/23000_1 /ASSEMBLY_ACC=CAM_ASM_000342 /TAXON_ID=268821 /ORGANISM="Scrippsiella Hangoei, Strain SHTV-5" /LENGTH=140 /DNA_ID=CAMNT_0050953587 /DNA_START=442 /DNA_END=866 /DNA_ORIENTATION=-